MQRKTFYQRPLEMEETFQNAAQVHRKAGGDARIRTGDKGFAGLCLTTWPRRRVTPCFNRRADRIVFSRLWLNTGADNGVRTRDPHLGKVVLYQLSHVRVRKRQLYVTHRVTQGGILLSVFPLAWRHNSFIRQCDSIASTPYLRFY